MINGREQLTNKGLSRFVQSNEKKLTWPPRQETATVPSVATHRAEGVEGRGIEHSLHNVNSSVRCMFFLGGEGGGGKQYNIKQHIKERCINQYYPPNLQSWSVDDFENISIESSVELITNNLRGEKSGIQACGSPSSGRPWKWASFLQSEDHILHRASMSLESETLVCVKTTYTVCRQWIRRRSC